MSVRLGRFMERRFVLSTTQFAYRKSPWVPMMLFSARHIHCKMHRRVGRRLGSYRLISAPPLIGSTIRKYSISSILWVLQALCCLFFDTVSINRSQHVMVDSCLSKLVNVASGVPQAVFWARYCSSCIHRSFFHSGE